MSNALPTIHTLAQQLSPGLERDPRESNPNVWFTDTRKRAVTTLCTVVATADGDGALEYVGWMTKLTGREGVGRVVVAEVVREKTARSKKIGMRISWTGDAQDQPHVIRRRWKSCV
ncbi:hypothetical protein HaLaN_23520 [Haematococcus lacustris]|uniref:Uncharacterized protein n=1 Tax=Haematococcus lacustris TaxID=44745 RepID=A0A6A0A036_HAELA|nr:hypothetical protein HaLaN_23520 [Haematococcus lacustris]